MPMALPYHSIAATSRSGSQLDVYRGCTFVVEASVTSWLLRCNSFVFSAVVSAAGKLMDNHLGYGLEVIRKGKATVDEEHVQSLVDLTVVKGRPHHTTVRLFLALDVTRAGFGDVDVGWGKAVYGGMAEGQCTIVPEMTSNFVSSENSKGKRFILMPISLPAQAMEVFARELNEMLRGQQGPSTSAPRIMSSI